MLLGVVMQIEKIRKYLDQFLSEQDLKRSTLITYRNGILQFIAYANLKEITHATRSDLIKYKNYLEDKNLAINTRNNYLISLNRFYYWASIKQLAVNIAGNITVKRDTSRHKKDALNIKQLVKLFKQPDMDSIQGIRDFAVLNLMVRTGVRICEIVRLNKDDIEKVGRKNRLWIHGKGKSGKDDYVVLTKKALQPIENYLNCRSNISARDPLFTSLSDRNFDQRLTIYTLSRMVKKYLRSAGIDSSRITAHSLRHSFAVLAMRAGSQLMDVQIAMRHKSPLTTQVYLNDIIHEKRLESSPEIAIDKIL